MCKLDFTCRIVIFFATALASNASGASLIQGGAILEEDTEGLGRLVVGGWVEGEPLALGVGFAGKEAVLGLK